MAPKWHFGAVHALAGSLASGSPAQMHSEVQFRNDGSTGESARNPANVKCLPYPQRGFDPVKHPVFHRNYLGTNPILS